MNKISQQEVLKQFQIHIEMQKKFAQTPSSKWDVIFKLPKNMDSTKADTLKYAALSHLLALYPDQVLVLLQDKNSFLQDKEYDSLWHSVIKDALRENTNLAKKLITLVPSIQKTTSIGTWITNAIDDDIKNFLITHWRLDTIEQPISWYSANGERVLYLKKPSTKAMLAAALTDNKPTIHPSMDKDLQKVIEGLEVVKNLYPKRNDWLPMAKKVIKQHFASRKNPNIEDISWLPEFNF